MDCPYDFHVEVTPLLGPIVTHDHVWIALHHNSRVLELEENPDKHAMPEKYFYTLDQLQYWKATPQAL
jgi:hypothetical protein